MARKTRTRRWNISAMTLSICNSEHRTRRRASSNSIFTEDKNHFTIRRSQPRIDRALPRIIFACALHFFMHRWYLQSARRCVFSEQPAGVTVPGRISRPTDRQRRNRQRCAERRRRGTRNCAGRVSPQRKREKPQAALREPLAPGPGT